MLLRLQRFFPQRLLSSFAGLMAHGEIPWLKNLLIRYFVWKYPLQLTEAIESDPYQYKSFNHFFTRQLKPEVRPIAEGINTLVCPADGSISQLGLIEEDLIFQAKGHHYSVQDLLGGSSEQAKPFLGGSFVTIYLAPKDYHRVHMPLDGQLSQMIYVPGKLFSVNTHTTSFTPKLFARNERVVLIFNTSIGKVAVILVGAMIVGSIETVWAGTITPPRKKTIQIWDYEEPIYLKRGEELGRFKLGSTVILLFEQNKTIFEPHLAAAGIVRMGEKIATLKPDQW